MNQRDLAKHLGINQSTVSLALRDDPTISQQMRQRIQEEAARLGYHANPYVSSLMSQVRAGKPVGERGCIALLVNSPSMAHWLSLFPYRSYYNGLNRRAEELGFYTEAFFLPTMQMSLTRLDSILYARSIKGVILASPAGPSGLGSAIQWDRYAIVCSSEIWPESVDRVANDHFRNTFIAYSALLERGYKRIGLCLPPQNDSNGMNRWLGGFCQCEQRKFGKLQMPIFFGSPEHDSPTKFSRWLKTNKPDVLLTLIGHEMLWLKQMGLSVPEDIAMACLIKEAGTDYAGVVEDNEQLGAQALELVAARIMHNQYGLSKRPRLTLIGGDWTDGTSCRSLPAAVR